jgi:hypothetical protein
MFHRLFSTWLRYLAGKPCFRIYGKAKPEHDWRIIDVVATHRRNYSSRLPFWGGTCITWTNLVIAVGWDFAGGVLAEQARDPASREHPVEIPDGRLRFDRSSGPVTASEVLAHECGHTYQACRMGVFYWIIGGAFTLFREGPHWYNRFENQASETGQFGGIVNGSVCSELMARLDLKSP